MSIEQVGEDVQLVTVGEHIFEIKMLEDHTDYFKTVPAQNIRAGQTFVHGQGGKHWTALADADSTNMRTHGLSGNLLVAVPVTFFRFFHFFHF